MVPLISTPVLSFIYRDLGFKSPDAEIFHVKKYFLMENSVSSNLLVGLLRWTIVAVGWPNLVSRNRWEKNYRTPIVDQQ